MAGGWSEEQVTATIRTGVTPYGKALNAEFMPWEVYAKMTDDELRAIRAYLSSLNGRRAAGGYDRTIAVHCPRGIR